MNHHTLAASPGSRLTLWFGLAAGSLFATACLLLGGAWAEAAAAWLAFLPFGLIAVFARLGDREEWARGFAFLGTGLLLLLLFFLSLGFTLGDDPAHPREGFVGGLIAILTASLLAGLFLLPSVRTRAGQWLKIRVAAPSQHLALFFAIALALLSFAPLAGTGRAVLLDGIDLETGGAGSSGGYALAIVLTNVALAFLIVGFGLKRGAKASWTRLGLGWRGYGAVELGLAVALGLVLVATFLFPFLSEILNALGIPVANEELLDVLMQFSSMTALAALGVSLSAGIGEEILFRGALQPRLGILLSNTLFTGMHAWQYTWDSVLVVALVGYCMARLRRRHGTLAAITAHSAYDLVLFLMAIS